MNVLDIIKMDIKAYRFVTCLIEPEDDVLFFNCQQNLEIDLPLAKELVMNRIEFTNNKKHYMIQQISNIAEINYDALQYLKDMAGGLQNLKGVAYLASNTAAYAIAEVFTQHQKKIPSKIFSKEKDAINWIKNLKEYHLITQQ